MAASYLPTHLRMKHQICRPIIDHGPSSLDEAPADYRMSCPRVLKLHKCPVPHCSGKTRTTYGMRLHFFNRHPNASICILEEGNTPIKKCPKCKMHVGHFALNRRHPDSKVCQRQPGDQPHPKARACPMRSPRCHHHNPRRPPRTSPFPTGPGPSFRRR